MSLASQPTDQLKTGFQGLPLVKLLQNDARQPGPRPQPLRRADHRDDADRALRRAPGGGHEVSSRVITDYNHRHTLTVQYYEVLQACRVETAVVRCDRVVFVPFNLVNFSNEDGLLRFRTAWIHAALTRAVRDALVNFDTLANAHAAGPRVILDIIFNHSGAIWLYSPGTPGGPWTPAYTQARCPFGAWLGDTDPPIAANHGGEEGAWPAEPQHPDDYTRAGNGSPSAGDIDDAEHKRSDFITLQDFRQAAVLGDLAECYKYWNALTDCNSFRIDTIKHVPLEEARNFCGRIKAFAANHGKKNFFLVGEVAGDYTTERNLNAALDIGDMRPTLSGVAKDLISPQVFFDGFDPGYAVIDSPQPEQSPALRAAPSC